MVLLRSSTSSHLRSPISYSGLPVESGYLTTGRASSTSRRAMLPFSWIEKEERRFATQKPWTMWAISYITKWGEMHFLWLPIFIEHLFKNQVGKDGNDDCAHHLQSCSSQIQGISCYLVRIYYFLLGGKLNGFLGWSHRTRASWTTGSRKSRNLHRTFAFATMTRPMHFSVGVLQLFIYFLRMTFFRRNCGCRGNYISHFGIFFLHRSPFRSGRFVHTTSYDANITSIAQTPKARHHYFKGGGSALFWVRDKPLCR